MRERESERVRKPGRKATQLIKRRLVSVSVNRSMCEFKWESYKSLGVIRETWTAFFVRCSSSGTEGQTPVSKQQKCPWDHRLLPILMWSESVQLLGLRVPQSLKANCLLSPFTFRSHFAAKKERIQQKNPPHRDHRNNEFKKKSIFCVHVFFSPSAQTGTNHCVVALLYPRSSGVLGVLSL